MALSFPKRSYVANATAGTLSTALTSTSTTFVSATSLATWEDVTGGSLTGKLCVCVAPETANEEKILCHYSAGTFTIDERNYNGETNYNIATAHPSSTPFILVWTATEAAEVQAAVQALVTLLTNAGTATEPVDISIDGTLSAGESQTAAPIDHVHVLSGAELATWFEANNISIEVSASAVTYTINVVNANYSTVTSDAGAIIVTTNTGAITITVTPADLATGQQITVIRKGSGGVTITGTGVFSNGATSGSPQLRVVGSAAQIISVTPQGIAVVGDII